MKIKTWKLWLLAGILFLFSCIMQLIDKKYFSGVESALLGLIYIFVSINNYKKDNGKGSTIEKSDTAMTAVDNKIKND